MFVAVLLFVLLLPAWAFGCTQPPATMRTPYTELIARTATIVLADAVAIEELGDHRARYHFTIVETLKGQPARDTTLTFARAERPASWAETDFDGHRDPAFWDRLATRQGNGPDCRMNPVFSVGSRYLLFVEEPYHWRSFERIVTDDDRWLATVRAVATRGAKGARVESVVQWLKEQRAVSLYRVDGCAGSLAFAVQAVDALRGVGPRVGSWQPVFVDFRPCRPGDAFLAIHYGAYGERHVTAYPMVDGVVDLTLAETEIELTGPRRLRVSELKTALQ